MYILFNPDKLDPLKQIKLLENTDVFNINIPGFN